MNILIKNAQEIENKKYKNKQINETLFSIVDHDNNDLLKIVFNKKINESLGTLKLQMFNINEEIDELILTNVNLLNNHQRLD